MTRTKQGVLRSQTFVSSTGRRYFIDSNGVAHRAQPGSPIANLQAATDEALAAPEFIAAELHSQAVADELHDRQAAVGSWLDECIATVADQLASEALEASGGAQGRIVQEEAPRRSWSRQRVEEIETQAKLRKAAKPGRIERLDDLLKDFL